MKGSGLCLEPGSLLPMCPAWRDTHFKGLPIGKPREPGKANSLFASCHQRPLVTPLLETAVFQ